MNYNIFNFIISLSSDQKFDANDKFKEIRRLRKLMGDDYCNGMISAMCIIGHGFFMLRKNDKNNIKWHRAKLEKDYEQLGMAIGVISSTISDERIRRTGRDPDKSLEQGVGLYLDIEWDEIDLD